MKLFTVIILTFPFPFWTDARGAGICPFSKNNVRLRPARSYQEWIWNAPLTIFPAGENDWGMAKKRLPHRQLIFRKVVRYENSKWFSKFPIVLVNNILKTIFSWLFNWFKLSMCLISGHFKNMKLLEFQHVNHKRSKIRCEKKQISSSFHFLFPRKHNWSKPPND